MNPRRVDAEEYRGHDCLSDFHGARREPGPGTNNQLPNYLLAYSWILDYLTDTPKIVSTTHDLPETFGRQHRYGAWTLRTGFNFSPILQQQIVAPILPYHGHGIGPPRLSCQEI